eukprot:scaffold3300_cov239-Pinguiococcus_pyrenoidosus.AAC.9
MDARSSAWASWDLGPAEQAQDTFPGRRHRRPPAPPTAISTTATCRRRIAVLRRHCQCLVRVLWRPTTRKSGGCVAPRSPHGLVGMARHESEQIQA